MEYPFHSQPKDNWFAHDDTTISVTHADKTISVMDYGTGININKKRQPKLTLFVCIGHLFMLATASYSSSMA